MDSILPFGLTTILFIFLILAAPMAFLVAFIAKHKGYEPGPWFFVALFGQILSLIAVCAVPVKEKDAPREKRRINPVDLAIGGKPAIDTSRPSHPLSPLDLNILAERWHQILMILKQHHNVQGIDLLLHQSCVLGVNNHTLEIGVPSNMAVTEVNHPRLTELIENTMVHQRQISTSTVRYISRPDLFPSQ